MKKIKHIIFATLIVLFVSPVMAQPSVFTPGDYRDGVYDKENSVNRRPIPYTHLRQADVTWQKRVWRKIDMREKINQQLYYPLELSTSRISLLQVLVKYVLSGEIMAFNPINDEFLIPMERSEIRDKLIEREDSSEVEQFDADGNSFYTKMPGIVDSTWMYRNLTDVEIKEDWYFDKQKSTLEVRILGMTFNASKKGKEEIGGIPQFSVYFPSCRKFLAKHEVFNVKNDSERRTFDDIFWKRQFSSFVTKESNVYDRDINFHAKGLEAILESDRVKGDIFRWEHDLWHF
ncbi:MAG: gliding motility protein GldN [Sphingobacteriaceae bacterium]|nr:gliding motility protein GldN [Sphingobacteriaceae bacterium]